MDTERTGGNPENSVAVPLAPPAYNPQPYLDALDVLQRNTQRNLTIWRIVVAIVVLLALPWTILWILDRPDSFIRYLLVLMLISDALAVFFPKAGIGKMDGILQEQFAESGLAERIALGELEKHDPIYQHTPGLLRWLIPKNPFCRPFRTLRRVAGSLYWYLAPPRRHMKPEWWLVIFLLPGLLLLCIIGALLYNGFGQFPNTLAIMGAVFLFGFMIMLVQQNYVMVFLLAKHLRTAWKETQPDDDITPDDVERKAKLQLMLNQVQNDLSAASFSLILPVIICLGSSAFLIINSVVFIGTEFTLLMFMGLVMLVPFWLMHGFLPKHGLKLYRNRLQEQLSRSHMFLLIASGDLDTACLIEHTPWVFRFIHKAKRMPIGFADNLREKIWYAALNLDWFLEPPRRLLRPSWVTTTMLVFVSFGSTVFSIMTMFSSIGSSGSHTHTAHGAAPIPIFAFTLGFPQIILLVTMFGLAIPGIFHAAKVHIWVEELIRHLRARLAG